MRSEPPYLTVTRTAYDTVAEDYARLLTDELAGKPLDRGLLATFAELVLAGGGGRVADLGCGPGRVTGHLAGLGLDAFGVDLSPGMVAVARARHPDLDFAVGSLTALDLADASLTGVLAWYSIIHTPPKVLPVVVAELARVLAPGGHLLLAHQAGGGELMHREVAYGHEVPLDSYRHSPARVADLLERHGLAVSTRVLREPDDSGFEAVPQSYLLARCGRHPGGPLG